MNNLVSVVIRNKNESKALEFLLKNLTERYAADVAEIIVLDNLSTDNSQQIAEKYHARFITIEHFSYGGSANMAATTATNSIVVIFSAHAYPISHDFFRVIINKFIENPTLAGVRCLNIPNDYRNYINKVSANEDPNQSGLIFAGSAFNKDVWETHKFKDDIRTFEDKEWSKRVLKNGYKIEFAPAIFSYEIKRTRRQAYFRFKNEIVGGYQLWHTKFTFAIAIKSFCKMFYVYTSNFIQDIFYLFRRLFFMMRFLMNKPKQF